MEINCLKHFVGGDEPIIALIALELLRKRCERYVLGRRCPEIGNAAGQDNIAVREDFRESCFFLYELV